VGEAIFKHGQSDYKITIKPRFGEKVLFRMLEEIFNIQITTSASQTSKCVDWQHYIKRIIAFIWLQKLANANLHGVPKTQVKREHKGATIRGRIDVRRSIKTFHQSNEVISTYREKQVDSHIAKIIFQAYQILKSDFEIGKINIPDSAKDAINQVHTVVQNKVHLSESDYRNIKYKDIYLSWKPVVDLSWDIIKRKQLSLKQDKAKQGFGFFIDMAEVWEQYLRATLKKHLLPHGWRSKNEKQVAYKGYFFQRELIPDLVFQKENEIAVWDAKYKRMKGRYYDVDRSDFFQIHTYIQYQLNHKTVKAGGLLYPISCSPNFDEYKSPRLINEEGVKLNFSIDGIELSEAEENEKHIQAEAAFINRIIKSIS
jgi:5-methylcytosine-specific restriction endonuclease McrBC regulatory subunit McrC